MNSESSAPGAGVSASGRTPCADPTTASDRRLLAFALAALPACWLALRIAGLRRCLALLAAFRAHADARAAVGRHLRSAAAVERATGAAGPYDAAAYALGRARQLSVIVEVAAGYAPGPVTCLSRSLLLMGMLAREGIDAELRIGVRKAGDALAAHAWVEAAGVPVNDVRDVAAEYVPFAGGLMQLRAWSR